MLTILVVARSVDDVNQFMEKLDETGAFANLTPVQEHSTDQGQIESTLEAAFSAGRAAVVDVRCDPEEKCYPMVPAGAASVDVIEAPEEAVL